MLSTPWVRHAVIGVKQKLLHRVIPQDGAERRNQEEERKKVSQQTSRQWFSRQKRPYILFKSTQLMIFYAFNEYFFK